MTKIRGGSRSCNRVASVRGLALWKKVKKVKRRRRRTTKKRIKKRKTGLSFLYPLKTKVDQDFGEHEIFWG